MVDRKIDIIRIGQDRWYCNKGTVLMSLKGTVIDSRIVTVCIGTVSLEKIIAISYTLAHFKTLALFIHTTAFATTIIGSLIVAAALGFTVKI